MKIGLQIPCFTWPGGPARIAPILADIAQTADNVGFHSLWTMDHFFQIPQIGPYDQEMLEGYSTLTYLASLTKNVKLGTMATAAVYRYPALLIKAVTTLDVLSGGRAYFGVGAAAYEKEAVAMGVPFPAWSERFEYLEETIQIAKQMWSGSKAAYRGKHHNLAETLCCPLPLSRPHPPILVAGNGKNKTLPLAARYGEACNVHGDTAFIKERLEILKRHCDAVGRDYGEIEKTSTGHIHLAAGQMSVKDAIDACKTLAAAGIQHMIFNMPNIHEIKPLETFGREVLPAVAAF